MSNDAPKPPPPPTPASKVKSPPAAPPPPVAKKPAAPPPPAPAVKAPAPPPPAPAAVKASPAPAEENPFAAVAQAGPAAPPPPEPEAALPTEPLGGVGALDDLASFGGGGAGLGGLGGFDEPFSDSIPLPSEDSKVSLMEKRGTLKGKLRVIGILALAGVLVTGGYMLYQRRVHDEQRLEAIGQIADQGEMLAALREELGQTGNQDLKRRIIMNLGHFRDAQAVPLLIQQLDDAGSIRRSAAWALARIGLPAAEPAKDKLLEVLPETDARDRAQVIWTLAVLRETDAADAIVEAFSKGQLQHLDGFSARVITDVLGPQRLSSEALINHPEAAVRVLTAHALAELSSAEAIEPLSAMITAELARPEADRSEEVIRSAAAGLGRSGDARAAAPLFAVLQSRIVSRQSIRDALASSTAAPDLIVLLGAAHDAEIRHDLVQLLADSHDPRAADTLATLVTDADPLVKKLAAFALADLGDARAQAALLELARSDDMGDARRAVAGLRNAATPELAPGLLTLAEERPDMKADIMRAMGATKNPAVARYLTTELDGADKRAAALAIADLDYDPLYRRLLGLVARPGHVDMGSTSAAERSMRNEDLLNERRAAILAMGRFGRADCLPALMEVVEDGHDDYELRGLAAAAIGQIGEVDVMREVLGKIRGSSISSAAKRYYVQALWQRPHAELNGQLLDLIQSDEPADLRRAAALAVGYSADPANDERLRQMLESDNTRRQAAFAIALGGGDEAVRALLGVLRRDADLREVLRTAVTGEDKSWFDLLSEDMFRSGAVWRRLRAAAQLRRGEGDTSYSYFWQHLVGLFQNGSDRNRGASARFVREQLWNALAGSEREQLWTASSGSPDVLRTLAAEALFDLAERGLLLRARDEGGPAGDAARAVMRAHEQATDDATAPAAAGGEAAS
jgi:HEAT repeat protein